jgi:hypothetical protein
MRARFSWPSNIHYDKYAISLWAATLTCSSVGIDFAPTMDARLFAQPARRIGPGTTLSTSTRALPAGLSIVRCTFYWCLQQGGETPARMLSKGMVVENPAHGGAVIPDQISQAAVLRTM